MSSTQCINTNMSVSGNPFQRPRLIDSSRDSTRPRPAAGCSKGGFALDLRLSERARFTHDVDIDWQVAEEELLDALIEAAALETEDYFTFHVERSSTPPERLGASHRFRVNASLAGRLFETFLLDVALPSDPVTEQDTLTTSELPAFARHRLSRGPGCTAYPPLRR